VFAGRLPTWTVGAGTFIFAPYDRLRGFTATAPGRDPGDPDPFIRHERRVHAVPATWLGHSCSQPPARMMPQWQK